MAFPPGINVEGATPAGEGRWCDHRGAPPPPARCRTSGQKGGVAPSTSSPTRAAPRRGVRAGDTRCRRPTGLYPIGFGQSVPTHVQCGFPGTAWTTTARASPSESGALGLLNGRATSCATSVRHPPFVRWSPIRRHVLDPRRRKSSIIPRPFEAGFSCSHWTIFSMTTSRLAWRSTVSSCTLNPRALPGRLDFLTLWHSRAPRNASWTDFPLRDRRSRRLWGDRNGRLAQRSRGRNPVRSNRPDTATKSQGNLIFSGGHNGGQDTLWEYISHLYTVCYINDK